MENCHLYKIECFHTLGTTESEWLKVTALNLFHPTASPLFQKVGFFILRHSLLVEEGGSEGENDLSTPTFILPPAFAEAPARRTRLWEAGLRAGRH